MPKYHDTGTVCTATKRPCPLGLSDGEHIEAASQEEFQKILEDRQGRMNPMVPGVYDERGLRLDEYMDEEEEDYILSTMPSAGPMVITPRIGGGAMLRDVAGEGFALVTHPQEPNVVSVYLETTDGRLENAYTTYIGPVDSKEEARELLAEALLEYSAEEQFENSEFYEDGGLGAYNALKKFQENQEKLEAISDGVRAGRRLSATAEGRLLKAADKAYIPKIEAVPQAKEGATIDNLEKFGEAVGMKTWISTPNARGEVWLDLETPRGQGITIEVSRKDSMGKIYKAFSKKTKEYNPKDQFDYGWGSSYREATGETASELALLVDSEKVYLRGVASQLEGLY